jgi:hypothetical protein
MPPARESGSPDDVLIGDCLRSSAADSVNRLKTFSTAPAPFRPRLMLILSADFVELWS